MADSFGVERGAGTMLVVSPHKCTKAEGERFYAPEASLEKLIMSSLARFVVLFNCNQRRLGRMRGEEGGDHCLPSAKVNKGGGQERRR